ncbi:hypothetical protein As57867_006783, partial [Aphanomyces stellatus]
MLACIVILVLVPVFGITATPPERENTKTRSINVEVDTAILANGIQIVDNIVSNGASISAGTGNTDDLPVQATITVVAAVAGVGRTPTRAPTATSPHRVS